MIRHLPRLSLLLLPFAALPANLPAQAPPAQQPIVVVITLDGFPARALEDPRLPMPTLRALAAAGAVSSGMRPINPTVTWPNHTSMITGVDASQHHVMANGLITQDPSGTAPKVAPWVDKSKLVHARTLYEAAAEKGLTTGQVDWVAIYGATGVRWQFGEDPDPTGEIPQELVAQHRLTQDQLEHFGDKSTPAWRDQIWTDAAVDILEHHTPNLLLFHLLETDSLQHQYGPLTPAAYAAYAYADHCIERVVEAARTAGVLDRTTFFLLSDHGFATYTQTIYPNASLLTQGLLHKQGSQYVGRVWVNAEGGAASVYIRDPKDRAELIPKLKSSLATLPGVAHVYTNREAAALGLPSDADTNQAPQLYLVAAPGYAFDSEVTSDLTRANPPRGQHGYLNTMPEMQALFLASGAAIKPGVSLGPIANLQVAPTIAKILGLSLPDAKQPPLTQILR